jgi:hypothetical protein
MEQSPSWEANQFSTSQEIRRNLGNPNVHYRIHKCLQPAPIVSKFYPFPQFILTITSTANIFHAVCINDCHC